MSYTLKLTNGKILLTLADQQSDNVSTSLTLIGKNVNAYGTDLNDNFVRLLENFANTAAPTSPLIGQLWFKTDEQRMYFYNASNEFKPLGSPIVAATQPVGLVPGDLWIDTTARQLKFYDGVNLIAAGPQYDYTKGKAGWIVETVTDSGNIDRSVVSLYSNGILLGILSDAAFTLRSDFVTSTGISAVGVGFTSKSPAKFIGTATNADAVGGINALNIMTTVADQNMSGTLGVYNDDGIRIGTNEDIQFYITGANRTATMALAGLQDFDFIVKSATSSTVHALYYSSSTGYLGVFNTSPQAAVDINGNLIVRGNLSVEGTSTSVHSNDLTIQNKLIELAYTTGTSTDLIANGGGIILHGTTDKSILWQSASTAWKSSEIFDLATGKTYNINGTPVISATALGTGITSALGLTAIGNLTTATIGNLVITTSTIGTNNGTPLVFSAAATFDIDFNGQKLKNAHTPSNTDPSDYVATKGYVDYRAALAGQNQYVFTVDVTGHATGTEDPALDTFVQAMLEVMVPPLDSTPYGAAPDTRARVMVTRFATSATVAVSDSISLSSVSVYLAGTSTPANVVGYNSSYVVSTTVPVRALKVNRAIKQYIVSNAGTWIPFANGAPTNTVYTDGTW